MLVPVMSGTLDALGSAEASGISEGSFRKLTRGAEEWLETASLAGPIAYIETDYFGGVGTQAAAVWDWGRLRWGPQTGDIGPVNEALHSLGVPRVGAGHDAFERVGLQLHRSNDRWRDDGDPVQVEFDSFDMQRRCPCRYRSADRPPTWPTRIA